MIGNLAYISTEKGTYIVSTHNDRVSATLLSSGVWKPHLQHLSRLLLRGAEQPVVIDVGAHLGAFSIPIAIDTALAGGLVIGFEVRPFQFYQLCANVLINRLENYIPKNEALGNDVKEIEIPEFSNPEIQFGSRFSIDDSYRRNSGLDSALTDRTFTGTLGKLDNLKTRSQVRLVKIDAEGVELDTVKGGVNFLAKQNYPPILATITSEKWYETKRGEFINYLSRLGYAVHPVSKDDILAQHPSYPIQLGFFPARAGIQVRRLDYSPSKIISIISKINDKKPLEYQLGAFGVSIELYQHWKREFQILSPLDLMSGNPPFLQGSQK
jgi:FkbM family methyltransferase